MKLDGPLNLQKNLLESFFLPNHGLWKDLSSTTKLRTLFNGSSKLSSIDVSLNHLLLTGPKLLSNLCDQLCSWRKYKYVFEADDEKMYRQVAVHEKDHKYQSIYWRFNSSDP